MPRHACISPAPLALATTTAAAQGYQMRDEGLEFYRNPDHDGGIKTAVHAWCMDPVAAKAKYGPIASWDTSGITNMNHLFYGMPDFNEDISRWNVSNVVTMDYNFSRATSFNGDLSRWNVSNVVFMKFTFCGATSFDGGLSNWEVGQVESMISMFCGATSFTHQLGGVWSTSTAGKVGMFYNSPGTIAGKVKNRFGTIV